MKIFHWGAVVVLTLMSLMNIGMITDHPSIAVTTFGVIAGVAGLVAVAGLVRRTGWGPAAALAIGVVNLVAGLIGLVVGWEGSAIGVAVSAVGLALTVAGESGSLRRRATADAR